MRCNFLAVLFIAIFAILPAHARLGETEDQCVARYGPVQKRDTSNATGSSLPVLIFTKDGYTIGAILLNGKVGYLQFQKADDSELSDNEIDTLLDANSDNQKWNKQGMISGRTVWFRDDGSQAQYHPDSHVLDLASKSYVEAANAAKKAAEDAKLKGF